MVNAQGEQLFWRTRCSRLSFDHTLLDIYVFFKSMAPICLSFCGDVHFDSNRCLYTVAALFDLENKFVWVLVLLTLVTRKKQKFVDVYVKCLNDAKKNTCALWSASSTLLYA